ncbi:MAG: hypothetical protein ACXADL_08205 [Candidatus Thorarchaeota archaeon]
MRNKVPFLMVLVGGILLFLEGAIGSIGFLSLLQEANTIPELADFIWIIDLILWVLLLLASGGGITVIIGGYLMTTDRVGTGKFVVGIGAGMGLIGLLVSLYPILTAYGVGGVVDFLTIASQSAGWVGAVLTIIGRQTAKKPE